MAVVLRVDGAVAVNERGCVSGPKRKTGYWEVLDSGILKVVIAAASKAFSYMVSAIDYLPPTTTRSKNFYITLSDSTQIYLTSDDHEKLSQLHKILQQMRYNPTVHLSDGRPIINSLVGGGSPQLGGNVDTRTKFKHSDDTSGPTPKRRRSRPVVSEYFPLPDLSSPSRPAISSHSMRRSSPVKEQENMMVQSFDISFDEASTVAERENNEMQELHESPVSSTDKENAPGQLAFKTSHFYGKPVSDQEFPIVDSSSSCIRKNIHTYSSGRNALSTRQSPRSIESYSDVSWIKASPIKSGLQGFSNLGNTCYMNAILQSLFNIEPFSKELWKCYQDLESYTQQKHLFRCFSQLLKCRSTNDRAMKDSLLRNIKQTISSTATRFSGYSQHDAHEFLGQVIDQLKEELNSLSQGRVTGEKPRPNPVSSNFEFAVCHNIRCCGCGNVVKKVESFQDLSLDMPSTSSSNNLVNLQDLLDVFFRKEQVNYRCEQCQADTSEISHKFTVLPRVLIVHLKRYSFNSVVATNDKIASRIEIPKYLTLYHHCAENTQACLMLTDSVKKVNITDASEQSSGRSFVHGAKRQLQFPSPTAIVASERRPAARDSEFKPTQTLLLSNLKKDAQCVENTKQDDMLDLSDDDKELQSVLERSKHEVAMCTDDQEEEYQKQLMQALEESKREFAEKSGFLNTSASFPIKSKERTNSGTPKNSNSAQKENQLAQKDQACSPSLISSDDTAASTNDSKQDEYNTNLIQSNFCITRSPDEEEKLRSNYEQGSLKNSFQIVGIVSHVGSSTSFGHYVADLWETKKAVWLRYDDSTVTEVTQSDVINGRQDSGYIFFYVAKEML